MITITQLEYIVALDKFGSFRQAAKACHVTQPTLSMQIHKLEDDLGVLIFDRTQQPTRATAIGRQIIEQARIALSQTKRINAIIDAAKDRVEGDLRLGVIPTLAPYLLPQFIEHFVKHYPKAHLQIEEIKTDIMIEALQRDQLDIAILATPLNEPSIREYQLFIEPFYLYSSPDSKLSNNEEITDADLKDEPILLLAEGHCLREQIIRMCRYRNSHVQINCGFEFASGSLETLCRLVEKGHGHTILPHLARTSTAPRTGRVIPFSHPSPSREISLAVHNSFARESLLKALHNSIRATLPAELKQMAPEALQTIHFR